MRITIEKFCNDLMVQVAAQLQFISNEFKEPDAIAAESYNYLIKTNQKLKNFISKYNFVNAKEEIAFFKFFKPQLSSLLIYHNEIYKLIKNKPKGGYKAVRSYFKDELFKIQEYFEENRDFYRYYRTQNRSLDTQYFIRGKHDIKMMDESHAFEFDERFSTPFSYKISKIMANEQIEDFLQKQLRKIEWDIEMEDNAKSISSPVHWTASKAALVELIYALDGIRAFNQGNIDLKTVSENLGAILNIDLSDMYRLFSQIKDRKTGKTKFLDLLREGLLNRLEGDYNLSDS